MRKLISLALASVLLLGTVGCHKTNTAAEPPGIIFQRTMLSAADLTDVVSAGLVAADAARKQLTTSGQLSADESAQFLKVLQDIATKNQTAVTAIGLASNAGDTASTAGWRQALLNVASAATQIDPVLVGIKNPNSQATLKLALGTLNGAIQGINASFGGGN